MRVLVVEDDPRAQEFLARGLAQQHIDADVVTTRAEGLARARPGGYDVLVVDVMLPDGDGFGLLEELRAAGDTTPALFLSARGEVTDRLRGFRLGADDYLAKPFAFAELVARIRAVARRRPEIDPGEVLRVADLVLDTRRHQVTRGGRPIELSARQFALLERFMRSPGVVFTRSMLIEEIWGFGFETRSNVLDVQIKVLRDKIDRGFGAPLLRTVRGIGYVLEDPGADGERGVAPA